MSEKTAAGRAEAEVRDRLAVERAEARRAAMSDDERAADEAEVRALRARIFGGLS